MRNSFRRQTETAAPSLRDRAADLSVRLDSAIRKPEPAPATQPETKDAATLEDFAGIELRAYEFDFPIKTPQEWTGEFSDRALMLHLADRTLRMTKPELMAFIREAGESDASTPAAMFGALDAASETLAGWGNLLGLARARYIVAASAACLEPETNGEAAHVESPPTALLEEIFPAAPTDLADACLWAVRHRAWIDGELKASEWSDEKFDVESAKTNAVFTRAINEPSANLREITAKAALALEDFERFHLPPGHDHDDGTRIVHTVLREIVGVGREAGASVALTPTAFDFGPDAHIAELASEFCEAYAANIKADREHIAERMSEAEWLPHYQRATAVMKKLEATEPKTLLGMALKCLGPIGAAGYNAPADESETQDEAWERVGTQFANAVLRDALAPLPAADWHASPVDLIAAAGMAVEKLPVSDLCAMLDATDILSNVAAAITCQPRQMTKEGFNGAGRLIEATAFALHRAIEAIAKELRGRTPADASDQAKRLASLASLTIHNGDEAETAAFARELLAMVEP